MKNFHLGDLEDIASNIIREKNFSFGLILFSKIQLKKQTSTDLIIRIAGSCLGHATLTSLG